MTGRKRSAKEKYRIVMEGIASGNRAETCRRHGISSQQYYQWRKRVEDSAMEGLKRKPGKQKKDNTKEMEQELDRMRRVIAEITSENVFLKKYLGLDSRKRFSLPMKRYLLREIERVRKRSGLSTR